MAIDWMKLFRTEQKASAQTAKERLLVVVSHQRAGRANGPEYLTRLREELLAVVRKYVTVDDSAVHVDVKREDGDEVLAMSITLPERS
ncbi:cell division topological specificity factor [Hydrocarboniphaga daqingensis]|jgi:cell division topological specificity factor|uniref:Cell division topological specificity factor n=1 Tax=Hydrocarboniphaga daqingensis TaxID=490188 RepID=A0A1M5M1A2_9GAMM|nr:cell division topological specificity factor MinE [Hydrocarboniphaga daqingensis]SHG71051.1 cell division topological specificity factor [Hydrocarboniphaga daqingensis]